MRFLGYLALSWLLNAIVLAIVAWAFTTVDAGTTRQLLTAAAVFGVLNTVLKPILRFITLPLMIITLGVAWFFVSMLMLKITDALVTGFDIHGFWALAGATVAVWVVNLIIDLGMALFTKSAAAAAAVA
jgi:putative membrane protein